ncbi:hypothetical protein DFH09DRAFT_1339391 [Mycena vulgaris]|nr:hypothetical protein DFH09DRAFT_1339391 [Mycena vulgaris]
MELTKLGIPALAYCRETLADARRNGINLGTLVKECTQWQVICVDPEHLHDKEWRDISEWPVFRARILFTVIDEAHLINEWGLTFRIPFKLIGLFVRGPLPRTTMSVVALSATLAPGKDTQAVCDSLGLFGDSFHLIRRSNERLNIQFILQILTHGLAGYDFPDLLPYLMSGRKTVIHCEALDLVFRVYVYILRLQANDADKLRRTRMYTSLCSDFYNQETIRLIDEDPHCQIIVATIAFSNGINARSILDSISLGFSATLDIVLQEKGRAGRAEDSHARGVVLVSSATVAAAAKQLAAPSPDSADQPVQPKSKSPRKKRKAAAPMNHEKALILVEKLCYIAFINRHYSNPPLETSTLDCIAAKRTVPCSLCCARSKRSLAFSAPPTAVQLPALIAVSVSKPCRIPGPRKLKLTVKEKKLATVSFTEFRDRLRAKLHMRGKFRHLPPILFLPSSLQTVLLEKLLLIKDESDLVPLLHSWLMRAEHSSSLYRHISALQSQIYAQRGAKTKSAKMVSKGRRKRKRRAESKDEEEDYVGATGATPPPRRITRPRKRAALETADRDSEEEADKSDSSMPEALLPLSRTRLDEPQIPNQLWRIFPGTTDRPIVHGKDGSSFLIYNVPSFTG